MIYSGTATGAGIFPGTATVARNRTERTPVWMWWNVLSLDAPSVAFLWALLFARAARVSAPALDAAVLAATVWVIYMSDRLLDGWSGGHGGGPAERHGFSARHRPLLIACLLAVGATTLWVSFTQLDSATRRAGWMLAGAVTLYFLAVHGARGRLRRFFPKELLVGTIFAAGTTLPAWTRGAEAGKALLAPAVLFGALCALNCIAIECWEHHRGGRQWKGPAPWLPRRADARIGTIAMLLLAAAGICACVAARASAEIELSGACALSLILLMSLEHRSPRLSPAVLRVLADAALLTPALFLLKELI